VHRINAFEAASQPKRVLHSADEFGLRSFRAVAAVVLSSSSALPVARASNAGRCSYLTAPGTKYATPGNPVHRSNRKRRGNRAAFFFDPSPADRERGCGDRFGSVAPYTSEPQRRPRRDCIHATMSHVMRSLHEQAGLYVYGVTGVRRGFSTTRLFRATAWLGISRNSKFSSFRIRLGRHKSVPNRDPHF